MMAASSLANLASTMQTLSCVKNVRELLPPSYSMHSIDLLDLDPNSGHPKMISVTLRTINNDRLFEHRRHPPSTLQNYAAVIRVVHGTEDVHTLIRKAMLRILPKIGNSFNNPEVHENDNIKENETEEHLETSVNGVWCLSVGFRLFESNFEAIKLSCKLLQALIRHGWEVVISPRTTITPGYEFSTWILKQVTTPALHTAEVSAFAIGDGFIQVIEESNDVEVSNVIRRAIKKCIKDKKSSESPLKRYTPASNCSENKEDELNETVTTKQGSTEKSIADKKVSLPPSCKESIGRLFGSKADFKDVRDDPSCPKLFVIKELKSVLDEDDITTKIDTKLLSSNLILEVVHLLFCRQWKFIAFSNLPSLCDEIKQDKKDENQTFNIGNISSLDDSFRQAEVYFFCKDGRILPALGQQTFAMIEIEYPNLIRLHNSSKEVSSFIGNTLKDTGWLKPSSEDETECKLIEPQTLKYNVLQYSGGFDLTYEKEDVINENNHRIQIKMPTFQNTDQRSSKEVDQEKQLKAANIQLLVGKLLLAMNKQGLNLYATTQLTCSTTNGSHRSQLIFRQSNVGYTQSLCLNLSGHNRLLVLGGDEEDVNVIRNAITTRWPYPISKDSCISASETNTSNENNDVPNKPNKTATSLYEQIWLFKVKRYPWAISYGNKKFDRTVETAKHLLPQLSIPPPQNMDPDSGKSLLMFALKDLAKLGWRVQTTANIRGNDKPSSRFSLPRPSHPNSIFLLR